MWLDQRRRRVNADQNERHRDAPYSPGIKLEVERAQRQARLDEAHREEQDHNGGT